jgi:2',3'-cyclic-nucleotide 2'-phosphodiesterase
MKILYIGEIVAKLGRKAVKEVLPGLISSDSIDLVVANAENLAHGRGANKETLQEMLDTGVNYFTGGDHIFWQKDFEDYANDLPLVCPANYPESSVGKTFEIIEGKEVKVVLLNLMGRTFMNENLDSPFQKIDYMLNSVLPLQNVDPTKDFIMVDFHAEASSEKLAFANYVDGRVSAVIGSHTHIPTADPQTLPKGTYFISDAGMTGSANSVLGVKTDLIIKKFTTAKNVKFEWEETGPSWFRSVLIDTHTKMISRIDRLV